MREVLETSEIEIEGLKGHRTLIVRHSSLTEPFILEIREDVAEILTVQYPVIILIGESRYATREAFNGSSLKFETFLKEQIGASAYHYHSFWKPSRKRHPDLRNVQRARNYKLGALDTSKGSQPWREDEIELILKDDGPTDRELARTLSRSVRAIQIKRSRCLTEGAEKEPE